MSSAEDLPVELLVMIFSKLTGKEAVACRAVCRRWRDVVDSLSDEVWERYCCRDFWNPQAANKVSNLGFRELYKSLALWSRVEEAEVTCKQVSEKFVHGFKILNDNKLAVFVNQNEGYASILFTNQVQYYNIKNMELIATECFDLEFIVYDENDKLITFQDIDDRLWVIIKSNRKKLFLDQLYVYGMANFKMFDTEVYYIRQNFLYVAQLKVVDNEETVEIVELTAMSHSVVAFASKRKNSVYILTNDGVLICYKGADLIAYIHLGFGESTLITYLMDFGFDWTEPVIYKWLKLYYYGKEVGLPAQKISAIHSHNHIVLGATCQSHVRIFKRPYKKNKTLKLHKAKPNISIEMGPCNRHSLTTSIEQLGVVEVLNGHRIIVLKSSQLFFVDLLHNTATTQGPHYAAPRIRAKKSPRSTKNKSVKDNGTTSKTKRNKTVIKTPENGDNKSVKGNRPSSKSKENKTATKNSEKQCKKNSQNSKAKGNKNATKKPEKENKKPTSVLTKHVYNTRSMDKFLHIK